ncbi:DUF4261 domain-containing protein [Mucilaginibacter sp. X5P1]|uniref:DUF4261 domain-containing protein n=1 Tax=Mucilaginibacter sp. X5P1 TaxID=2723088 RepID=UPI001616AA7E|nr:DUF4261 domain-containing protein [Mucilaginibacter sp. X5P1]MBB6137323.1 hypothetical protein [Mucilaginibacter sp. X5P1]
MSLFNLFKKNTKPQASENNILLAMPIFNNGDSYDINNIIENLKSHWGFDVTDIEGDNNAVAFNINGETIALAYIPVQIPWDDIEGTAKYAYNWPNASEELKDHGGHAIVSIMSGQKSPLERFKILSKVLYSILITSDAVGVYQGAQSLLIPRNQYLDNIDVLENDDIPVTLWVYIGLKKLTTGNCAYTYGLKEFNNQEIEIIDSKLSLEELFDFLFNITSYVLCQEVTLKIGETIGLTADQKIAVTSSKGEFVKGQSIKLKV